LLFSLSAKDDRIVLGAGTWTSLADEVIGNEATEFHRVSQWRHGMGRRHSTRKSRDG
jgi:hypothetical protein